MARTELIEERMKGEMPGMFMRFRDLSGWGL